MPNDDKLILYGWAPTKEIFEFIMGRIGNPLYGPLTFDGEGNRLTGAPLAYRDAESGELIATEGVRFAEIGEIRKPTGDFHRWVWKAEYAAPETRVGVELGAAGYCDREACSAGDDGAEQVMRTIGGYHVNFWIVEPLRAMMTNGMPTEGTVFERTRILELLGSMEWAPITEAGVPAGYEGTSGMRLFDPGAVSTPALEFC